MRGQHIRTFLFEYGKGWDGGMCSCWLYNVLEVLKNLENEFCIFLVLRTAKENLLRLRWIASHFPNEKAFTVRRLKKVRFVSGKFVFNAAWCAVRMSEALLDCETFVAYLL